MERKKYAALSTTLLLSLYQRNDDDANCCACHAFILPALMQYLNFGVASLVIRSSILKECVHNFIFPDDADR